MLDAAVNWRASDRLAFGATAQRYDNEGSFAVDREDLRLYVGGDTGRALRWNLAYRYVDFEEGGGREFDADLVELTLGLRL